MTTRKEFISSLHQMRDVAKYVGSALSDCSGSHDHVRVDVWLVDYLKDDVTTEETRDVLTSALNASGAEGLLSISPEIFTLGAIREPQAGVAANAFYVRYSGEWNQTISQEFQVTLLGLAGVMDRVEA